MNRKLFSVAGGRLGGSNFRPYLNQPADKPQTVQYKNTEMKKIEKAPSLKSLHALDFSDHNKLVIESVASRKPANKTKTKTSRAKKVHDKASNVTSLLDYVYDTPVDGTGNSTYHVGVDPLGTSTSKPDVIPLSSYEEKGKFTLSNSDSDRVVHKTTFQSGKNTSRAIKNLIKQNGSLYKVLHDTKINYQANAQRETLTFDTGFNQRSFYGAPAVVQVPLSQFVDSLKQGQPATALEHADRQDYYTHAVASVKNQFMFHNQAANFPAKLKVHVCRVTNYDQVGLTPCEVINAAFHSLQQPIPAEYGKVPLFYQHSDIISTSGLSPLNEARLVYSSNKGKGLKASTIFRSAVELVKTFSKELQPGDFWNFNHIHHCGSGLDSRVLFEAQVGTGAGSTIPQRRDFPLTYLYIFELAGKTVEGYINVGGPLSEEGTTFNQFIGTSPSFISFEQKASVYGAKNISPDSQQLQDNTRFHVIYNSSDPYMSSTSPEVREIYVTPDRIRDSRGSAEAAGEGAIYIPTSTTSNITSQLVSN